MKSFPTNLTESSPWSEMFSQFIGIGSGGLFLHFITLSPVLHSFQCSNSHCPEKGLQFSMKINMNDHDIRVWFACLNSSEISKALRKKRCKAENNDVWFNCRITGEHLVRVNILYHDKKISGNCFWNCSWISSTIPDSQQRMFLLVLNHLKDQISDKYHWANIIFVLYGNQV